MPLPLTKQNRSRTGRLTTLPCLMTAITAVANIAMSAATFATPATTIADAAAAAPIATIATAAAAATVAASTQSPQSPKLPAFDRMDVFDLEWASDPQIAPDGRQVVYARRGMDIMRDRRTSRLWIIEADGSNHRSVTGRDTNERMPRYSPDGQRVAFVSDAGHHGAEIHVHWLPDGPTTRLTQLQRSPSGLAWSPDGQYLAFSMLVPEKPPMLVKPPQKPKDAKWAEQPRVTTRLKYESDGHGYNEPGHRQYFVIPAEGGSPRQVTDGNYRHGTTPVWTADGTGLVFSGNRSPDHEHDYRNSELYRADIETGAVTPLTERKGPDHSPATSPDGRHIAWLGFADRVQTYQVTKLQLMDADGGNRRTLLDDLDRSISAIAWNAAGNGLYFQYDDHGDTHVGFVSLRRPQSHSIVASALGGTVIGRPYGGGSFSVADNGRVAYTHSTPYRPADVALVGRAGAEPRLLTALNADLLPHRALGKIREIRFASSIDGRDIQGWLVSPPHHDADGPPPLIVEIHGGPISNYGPRFSPEMQLYAAAGYAVFYPNPRGSTGYGEAFGNLLHHDYPGGDYQDIMDGTDHLVETGLAAEDRLYVTGGSAGGIMSAWMIGKSDRFRAAAVVKPVMNWISKTLTADNYFFYADYRFPGQPWENMETYMRYSPISLAGRIVTPTLVMVGTADLRTPLSEAKQLYSALKIRDIDTALVEIPGASHAIATRPSQLIAKVDHVLAWFARYNDSPAIAPDGEQ